MGGRESRQARDADKPHGGLQSQSGLLYVVHRVDADLTSPGLVHTWWVNQGSTYAAESTGGLCGRRSRRRLGIALRTIRMWRVFARGTSSCITPIPRSERSGRCLDGRRSGRSLSLCPPGHGAGRKLCAC